MNGILERGLFGGLLKELKLSHSDLAAHVAKEWRTGGPVSAISDISVWARGGAETYVARSRIERLDGTSVDVWAKAFVGMGLSPQAQQDRWETRRSLFQVQGIRVPFLYAQYPALSIEEYIPGDLILSELDWHKSYQLGEIARHLCQLHLQPLSLISDVRIKEEQVYVVDLGTDISRESERDWPTKVATKLTGLNRQAFLEALSSGQTH